MPSFDDEKLRVRKMGRFPGRGYSGRGRGRNERRSGRGSTKKSSTTTRQKTLGDHQYHCGSVKQASDYVTVTRYLVNYVRRTYDKGEDIANALETLEEVDFKKEEPIMKVSTATGDKQQEQKEREDKQFEKQYEIQYQEYNRRITQYKENKAKAEAMLWNQCTNTMKSKVQSRKDYESDIKGSPIKLLQAIKQHALSYESTQYRMKTICDAMKSLVNLKQRDDEHPIEYLKRFKAARDVFISHVGKSFHFPRVLEEQQEYLAIQGVLDSAITTSTRKEEAQKEMTSLKHKTVDEFLAYVYLENTDRSRYGSVLTGLETQFSLSHDQYPKSLIDAQNVIENHTYDPEYRKKRKDKYENRSKNRENKETNQDNREQRDAPSLSFAQMRNTCYCCGKNHKLPDCPDRHSTPKDQWHINKAKEAKMYQNMVTDIERTMNEDLRNAGSSTGSVAPAASSITDSNSEAPSQDKTWAFFNFAASSQDSPRRLSCRDDP